MMSSLFSKSANKHGKSILGGILVFTDSAVLLNHFQRDPPSAVSAACVASTTRERLSAPSAPCPCKSFCRMLCSGGTFCNFWSLCPCSTWSGSCWQSAGHTWDTGRASPRRAAACERWGWSFGWTTCRRVYRWKAFRRCEPSCAGWGWASSWTPCRTAGTQSASPRTETTKLFRCTSLCNT